MVCGGSSCDIDKLELWRPTLFLEEILSVSAEIQRFSLRASSPIPTNDHQKLYFIHFIKNMFIYYLYLVSVLLVLDFLLQDIYFTKSLERHCCHQQWVQDMVSWARFSSMDPQYQSSVPVWLGSFTHNSPEAPAKPSHSSTALATASAGSSHFWLPCLAASTIMSDSSMSCFLS